ncbi:MAG TPA: hypothetical protein VH234_05960, partial [Candidatus Saccharimonadales bacterium]|nr:hypothetical protein [Candidatus Saccharimonadales bacterium]
DEEDLPKKFDYGKPVGALAAAHEAENPETIDLDDDDEAPPAEAAKASKIPKGAKVKVPNFDRFRLMLGLGVLAFVALIVFLILAIAVLPKAKITIQTSSEPVAANFTLNAAAGAALDPAKGTIPAKLESMDQTGSQSVTATGSQNNGTQATGTMVFYNCNQSDTLSGTNHTVGAGTGVTLNGLSYITKENANVPPSHFNGSTCKNDEPSNSVDVTAQTAGAKYNQDASGGYSVAGYSSITGSGSKMTGGTDNVITVLSQSDVDGAAQKLTTGATADSFTKSFEDKLAGQGEYVFVSTLKAAAPVITATPAVGQPASTSTVAIKITYTVLAVQKSDLSTVIQAKLASQIDKTKQKLNGNFLNDADITVQSQPAPNSAVLAVNENTTAVPIIDIASVKKQAEGKKVGDIKSAIGNWAGVKSVNVQLSPFWVSKAPGKGSKITVILQEVKNSSNSSAP